MTEPRSPLRVLAGQINVPDTPTPAARDRHVAHTIQLIESDVRAHGPVDLVVLPELSTISYDRATFQRLADLAEPLDGPSVSAFADLARRIDTVVVFGMPRVGRGLPTICQIAVGQDGHLLGHYDKLHTAQFGHSMEKEFFTTGDHLLTFDCAGRCVAPIICYDIRFPELARTLVSDHGADLILHCSAFSRDESFPSWHPFLITRAMENQVPVLGLSRAGDGWGGSLFCGPWVDDDHPPQRFAATAPELRRLTIDSAETARVRAAYTFLDDRLPDYRALSN